MKPSHFLPTSAISVAMAAFFLAMPAAHAADRVFFEEPQDNAKVTSPVTLKFGLEGMRIAPTRDKTPGTGHHHILIDADPIPKGEGIDVDDTHIHYNTGLTSAKVELTPGVHKLTLQFGNGRHQSYGPEMAATITVTVVPK